MEHPKAKGDRTTLAVMLALHEVGVAFAVPFGENTRYDLIIEAGGATCARAVQDRSLPERMRGLQCVQ